MNGHMPRDAGTTPTGASREAQYLGRTELIVYEAIATVRRPMGVGDLVATTGLDEKAVRTALDRLAEFEMIAGEDGGVVIGPNDWDVRGAR